MRESHDDCISKRVALRILKVTIPPPEWSSTIARVLIDPGSSALFGQERIAQHLRLQCSNKDRIVEGFAGTTMPTLGSIWF